MNYKIWIYLLVLIGFLLFLTISCKKKEDVPNPTYVYEDPNLKPIVFNPNLTYGTMKDIDGNVYKTITIGTQTWMAENLRVTKYRNGDTIGTTYPPLKDISLENAPKYQWAPEGRINYVPIYGRLYTWYTVTDSRNVCPVGWHLPDNLEWTTLDNYLSGDTICVAKKLKEKTGFNATDMIHWCSSGCINQSGFTALPNCDRSDIGGWGDGTFCSVGYWWCNYEENITNSYARELVYLSDDLELISMSKRSGLSVRCIKD